MERSQGRNEKDEAGGSEVPHDNHELASLELRVTEDSLAQENQAQG
jgi:hypothetical protein